MGSMGGPSIQIVLCEFLVLHVAEKDTVELSYRRRISQKLLFGDWIDWHDQHFDLVVG